MAKPIEISERTNLTLDEATEEYIALRKKLNAKTFPQGGTGWSQSVLNRIEARMDSLRRTITDAVCPEEKEQKNGR